MQLEHSLRSLKNLILTVKAKYFHQLLVVCLFVFFLIVKSAEALIKFHVLNFLGGIVGLFALPFFTENVVSQLGTIIHINSSSDFLTVVVMPSTEL